MATTGAGLYRSAMGNDFKSIKVGIYPGDGVARSALGVDPIFQQEA